jgi:hypothetical protein
LQIDRPIKSHIIPKAFGKFIRDEGLPNIQLRWDRVGEAKPQLGEFDTEILCADCDNKLGRFDDYAFNVCRRFRAEHRVHGECFELRDVDGALAEADCIRRRPKPTPPAAE